MLEVRDVSVAFGDTVALKNFGLKMKEGEVMGVLGPSGCGKTTLLRVVAGLQPADSGDVLWGGSLVVSNNGSLWPVPWHRHPACSCWMSQWDHWTVRYAGVW